MGIPLITPEEVLILAKLDPSNIQHNVDVIARLMKNLQLQTGASFDAIKMAMKDALTFKDENDNLIRISKEMDKQIGLATNLAKSYANAANAREKAFKKQESQGQTVVDYMGIAQDKERARQEKQGQIQADAIDDLNKRLKNGTASYAEYAKSIKLSANTMKELSSIQAGTFNRDNVEKVRKAMVEIQSITKLSTDKVRQLLKTMFPNIDYANLSEAEQRMHGFARSMKQISDTVRGTLTAMFVFQSIQFFLDTIKKAVESVKTLEMAILNLGVAERALSTLGVDISPDDFKKIISDVRGVFGFMSEVDTMDMVSNLAILTKDLGLTKEQIRDLAMDIPARAALMGKSIENMTGQIANGLTKHAKGWADIGLNQTAATIKDKVFRSGLVKDEEAWNKLTAAQQQYYEASALILILNESNAELMKSLPEYQKSVSGSFENLSSSWEDFLGNSGELFRNTTINLADFFSWVLDRVSQGVDALKMMSAHLHAIGVATKAIISDGWSWKGRGVPLWQTPEYQKAYQEAMSKMSIPFDAKDTKTGVPPIGGTDEGDTSKVENLAGAMDKMQKEILQAQIRFSQDMQDIEIDLGRKMVDIDTEYLEKQADLKKKYSDKISDINDAQAEDAREHRNDELKKEREFQNSLQEMKEKFLLDLEDALHERDARAILKLINNYNLEKTQAERKYNLDKENDRRDFKLKQEKYEREKKQAKKEYEENLARLKAEEEAEVRAAVLAANRKIQDLEKNNADRLAIVFANLKDEYNLTAAGLSSIVGLYMKYYTDVTAIYQAMRIMMGGSLYSGTTGYVRPTTVSKIGSAGGTKPAYAMAEGGSIIADRPTPVIFGESGLEMATFTPIGRTGRDVNKIFSNSGGTGAMASGGMVSIELLLSPDLENRIVKNTLNQTAEVIMRTTRSR